MALDNNRFLNQVKMKGSLPTGRFTDQELLDVAFDVLLTDVQPWLTSIREEYYVNKSNTTITSGTSTYSINSRASGSSLRELKWVDSAGQVRNLSRVDPVDINDNTSGAPTAFYLQDVSVVLYPTPDVGGTLVQSFVQRINRPVDMTECASITAIDTLTGVVTATAPSGWSISNTFDLISRENGNSILAKDLTATALDSTTITFTPANLPSNLAIGDYVALAGETPYIQVPDEVVSLVVQLTVADLLESMGDTNGSQMALGKAERLRQGLTKVLAVRVQGEGIKFRPQV